MYDSRVVMMVYKARSCRDGEVSITACCVDSRPGLDAMPFQDGGDDKHDGKPFAYLQSQSE